MPADLTVLTPTIPGRERLLAECVESVFAQTVPVDAHYIAGRQRDGNVQTHAAMQRNSILAAATSEWVCALDDDDLWLPNHVETILHALKTDADVVYTWDADEHLPRENCNEWSQQQLVDRFEIGNFIAAGAAIRRSTLLELGGWPTNWEDGHFAGSPCFYEDWELWRRASRAGVRFHCVPVPTWKYRPGDWPRMTAGL